MSDKHYAYLTRFVFGNEDWPLHGDNGSQVNKLILAYSNPLQSHCSDGFTGFIARGLAEEYAA